MTSPTDQGLCVVKSGYTMSAAGVLDLSPPIVTDGLTLYMLSQPTKRHSTALTSRRLLGAAEVVERGYGSYKAITGDGACVPCPGRNTSTAMRGATSVGACRCQVKA